MSFTKSIDAPFLGPLNKPLGGSTAAVRGIDFSSPLVLDATFTAGDLPAASLGISAVVWVRKTVNSGRYVIDGGLSGSGAGGQARITSGAPSNTMDNQFSAALGGNVITGSGPNEFPSDGVWKCVFFSGAGALPITYVNDTETTYSGGRAGTFPINFSAFDNFTIGSSIPIRGAGNNWAQDISDVWVSFGTRLDFSSVGIRRAFCTAGGKAVTLADNGTVFGTRPHFYFSVRAGQALNTYRQNRGSIVLTNPSALLTIRSGVLTASLTSPA